MAGTSMWWRLGNRVARAAKFPFCLGYDQLWYKQCHLWTKELPSFKCTCTWVLPVYCIVERLKHRDRVTAASSHKPSLCRVGAWCFNSYNNGESSVNSLQRAIITCNPYNMQLCSPYYMHVHSWNLDLSTCLVSIRVLQFLFGEKFSNAQSMFESSNITVLSWGGKKFSSLSVHLGLWNCLD